MHPLIKGNMYLMLEDIHHFCIKLLHFFFHLLFFLLYLFFLLLLMEFFPLLNLNFHHCLFFCFQEMENHYLLIYLVTVLLYMEYIYYLFFLYLLLYYHLLPPFPFLFRFFHFIILNIIIFKYKKII